MADFSMYDMGADPVQAVLKGEATLAQMGAQTRGDEASADLHELQAIKLMQDMGTSNRLAELAQARVAANPKAPMSELLQGLTLDAGAAGDPHMMAQLAGHASAALGHEAQTFSAMTQARRQQLDAVHKTNEVIARWIGTATDPQSWATANAAIQRETGAPSPYAQVPYDPRFVKQAQDASMTYKDRIEAERKATADEERVRYHDAIIAVREQLAQIRENYNNIIRDKKGATSKTEGKPIASPSKEQRDLAFKYLKDNKSNLEEEDLLMAGSALAEQARKLVQTQPGLTYTEALPRAAKLIEPDFQEQEKWGGLSKRLRFLGAGKTPLTALTLPSQKDRLMHGRYYDIGQDQVGKWDSNTQTFEPVAGQE